MCLFLCELHFCLRAGLSRNICEGDFFVERSVWSTCVSLSPRVGLPQDAWESLMCGVSAVWGIYWIGVWCEHLAKKGHDRVPRSLLFLAGQSPLSVFRRSSGSHGKCGLAGLSGLCRFYLSYNVSTLYSL